MSPCTFLLVFLLFSCIRGLGRANSAQRSIEHHNGVTKRRLPQSVGIEKNIGVQYKNVSFSARATGPFAVQQSQTGPNFVQLTSTSQVPRRRRRQQERNVNSEEPPMRSGNRRWGWLSPRAWLRGAASRLGRGTNSRRCNESPEIVLPPGIAVIASLLQQLREEIERFSVQQRNKPQLERAVKAEFFRLGTTKTLVSKACGLPRTIKFEAIISSGTWSTVWRVTDIREKKQYALKIRRLRGALSGKAGYTSILKEGQSMIEVSPAYTFESLKLMVALDILRLEGVPHFVKETDSRHTIANLFLLMPLAKTDLLSFLQALFSRPPISESPSGFQARLKITAEAVTIVANFQKPGVVHGDIQPQKMLIMPNGSVVLGGPLDIHYPGTRRSPDVFTVPYLPPELLDEEGVYSYLTDSWQLGLTLYQIWCLRLPFGLMTPVVADDPDYYIVEEVLRKPDAELSFEQAGCVANIPEYVESLIKQLLQFNPENRLTPARILVSRDFNRLRAHVDHLERSARKPVDIPPPRAPRRVGWGLSGLQDGTELQSNNTNLESQN
uniref:non-specific serine/threonine protein kinase n=1 Tax=Neospora caninum (strain Liverpool) TaxID=572307 RepID=A0A0F7U8C2_NEOCL|nr:TPA: rhoptry kinase family protein ROP24 (incomplete catalytic triad) [Neospora caninum Liverpool]